MMQKNLVAPRKFSINYMQRLNFERPSLHENNFSSYDHPHIMAGQGTLGLEVVEQVANIDAIIVPVGGGGLIAGVALAIKTLHPHVKVIVSS